ncbi:MAG: LysR substrate-binding domain-containing protein [Candidatus Dactylopiibacterium sp.]|nr:LysR substrate-binding domain-containing protein [Candidatus Dactylopiibacterium sp.]
MTSSPLSSRSFLRQLDLGTLDLFMLICESGSIARAAERGQLAASALSKRIAELETVVGAPLFERHARGVKPTFMGEQLANHAHNILVDVERLRGELSELSKGVRGRVRLFASASAVEQFLPGDLSVFTRAHPEIRIDLRQSSSRTVADAVLNREADLGICGHCDEVARLQSRPYRTERLVLVMPHGHPLASLRRLEYARALEYEQIGVRGSSTVQANLNRVARESRRVLRQRIEVDSLSAMCRMIECGMGIGVMPLGAFQALGERHLHAAELTDPWAVRALNLYALDFSALPAPARHFAERLTASG